MKRRVNVESAVKRRGLLALALGPLAAGAATPPRIHKADLFTSGEGGYALYRIPGIVTTRRGTALAYCEARRGERGDWGPTDILLRRSTNGGRSFSPPVNIAQVPGPHPKNPVALAQNLAAPGDVTYNNPVAIADLNTGAVHFLFCLEYMRCFYMGSTDDGRTFSTPVEITATFEEFQRDYPWKVIATGPGHGIQLRNGRLVVPVWLSPGTGGHAHRPSVASTIYSDDAGQTWKRGEIAIPDTPEFVFPSEAAVVELAGGRVMLNARSESKAHRRLVTTSPDGAGQWSPPRFHPQLNEPICMASLVRLSTAQSRRRNRILFSNPDNLERAAGAPVPGQPRDRRNLTVRLSYDEGQTWAHARSLEPGPAGYSDLAVLPSGDILCLFERGAREGNAYRTASLTLARFNLEWLTGGADSWRRPPLR